MARTKWNEVLIEVRKSLNYFDSQRVTPTLRTLFYNLVSQNIIGNTRGQYQGLSKLLVQSRKNGSIAWNAIADNVRVTYGNFSDSRFSDSMFEDTKDVLDGVLAEMNTSRLLEEYFDYHVHSAKVSFWADQPTVCEIWVEKDALAGTLKQWTSDLSIPIRVNKGYSSWTFLKDNAVKILRKLESHEKVVIFYCGDLDPSGVDMERFLIESLAFFGLDDTCIEFKRLGVTKEQVEQYSLPPRPDDSETLAKLRRDPRNQNYCIPYVVELDALVAYVPSEFKELIRNSIMEYWNEEIYTSLVKESREINSKLETYLREIKVKARALF